MYSNLTLRLDNSNRKSDVPTKKCYPFPKQIEDHKRIDAYNIFKSILSVAFTIIY